MRQNFITLPHPGLGSGIDALSPEDSIRDEFSEDLLNIDPTPEGSLKPRTGYQRVLGNLPIRVVSIDYVANGTISLQLDGSIDLSRIQSKPKSRPVILLGKTSQEGNPGNEGDFPWSESIKYFSGFDADIRKSLAVGQGTLTIPAAEHSLETPYIWVGLAESLELANSSHSTILSDEIAVDKSTYEIGLDYENNTTSPIPVFLYTKDASPQAGVNYVTGGLTATGGTTSTFTVTAATHNLSNTNILAKVFQDTGTELVEIKPESVVIDSSGNVTVEINNGGPTFTCYVSLSRAEVSNVTQGTVPDGTQISIPIPVGESPYSFVSCYLEVGSDKEMILPDEVTYDFATNTKTVTFTNNTGADASFFIYWIDAALTSSRLTLKGTPVNTGFFDPAPALTLYGLDHEVIYNPEESPRGGWVTHLDTYRSEGESFLVAGLGGNFFKGQVADAATQGPYLMGSAYTFLRRRVQGSFICGPAFVASWDTVARTAGYLQADNVNQGWVRAEAFTWDAGKSLVKVEIPLANPLVTGAPIDVTPSLEDRATIKNAPFKCYNGTFTIKDFDYGADSLTLWIDVPGVEDSDWDDVGGGAQVGIFTDRVTLNGFSYFLPGDRINSELFTLDQVITCVASSGTTLLMDGLTEPTTFANGLRIGGTRKGSTLPLRDDSGAPYVDNFVEGDVLNLTGLARTPRIKSINTLSDVNVTIDGDSLSGRAIVTLSSGTIDSFAVGDGVLLVQAGPFTGSHTIAELVSTTSFAIESSLDESGVQGVLQGKTLTLDEELEWSDITTSPTLVEVTGRWLPIEAPEANGNLPPTAYSRYFTAMPYDNQPFVKSTMSADSMFFTQGKDRPLKFDGLNIYRPGLIRWQPQSFVTVATSPDAGGVISLDQRTAAYSSASSNKFEVAVGDAFSFPIGLKIKDSDTGEVYFVTDRESDLTNSKGYIVVDRDIVAGSGNGTLQEICTYAYYFRLNAVDLNGNIIASAATGYDDYVIELSESSQVRFRLTQLPPFDIYDYDRIEVQIYRTKKNGVAPFYLLTTLPLIWNYRVPYIDYVDTDSDEDLRDLDPVNTALKGAELGVGWSPQLRSNAITATSNRLVLGGFKSDPYIDLRFVDRGTRITPAVLKGSIFTLRKDNADPSFVTDMVNVINYEMVDDDNVVSIEDLTATTGSVTIESTGHGLSVGNWVYLFRKAAPTTNASLAFAGYFQIEEVPDADHFSFLNPTSVTTFDVTDEVDSYAVATNPADVPVYLGEDFNYINRPGNKPITNPYESVAVKRFANAVNQTQRTLSRSLYPFYQPWILAEAGGEYALGQIVFKQPFDSPTTFEIQLPDPIQGYYLFANDIRRQSNQQVSAITELRGSRVLASYPNFPEIFDSPLVQVDSDSDSAIDVNPADGQDITAIIPFFGESAFGAAQQDSVIVVFKANSIYLVNLAAKAQGQNPVQKIESQGLGCTMPRSVCPVKDGIVFANASGVYKLGHNLKVTYLGRRLQRLWRNEVSKDELDLVNAGNWSFENLVNISVPYKGAQHPADAFVYNSTREYVADGYAEGAWTHYDNLRSIGWANQEVTSHFASVDGRVYSRRQNGDSSDARDDDKAIHSVALLKAMDFGDEGVRKVVSNALVSFRNPPATPARSGVQISFSKDLSTAFEETDQATLPSREELTGTGDYEGQKGVTLRYSLKSARCNRIQLRIEHETKDESYEITKLRYRVAGLTQRGITESKVSTLKASKS